MRNDQTTFVSEIRSFNRFYTDIIGLLDQHLLDTPFSLAEARIVYEIHHHAGIQASQIMELMHIDKSYLSRLLKKLEKERVIERKRSVKDARAVTLFLTAKGEQEFEMLNKATDEQIGNLIEPFSLIRRKQLTTDMRSVMDAIKSSKFIALNDIAVRSELFPGDLGYVAWLHGKLYAEECGYMRNFEAYVLESLGEWAHSYDPVKDKVWVCEHGGRMIGFLAAVDRVDSLQLRYFILLPEYRGIGLAKKLMDEFMAWMKQRGHKKAYLWTSNEQQTATVLYKRYGFTLAEEKPSVAFDKPLTEQRYELQL